MPHVLWGVIAGVVFGAVSVVLMLPMPLPDKGAALTAAFIERFSIGLVIGCVELPLAGWYVGLFFGLLLSLPSAIITKALVPILTVGGLGGLLIGGLIHGFAG